MTTSIRSSTCRSEPPGGRTPALMVHCRSCPPHPPRLPPCAPAPSPCSLPRRRSPPPTSRSPSSPNPTSRSPRRTRRRRPPSTSTASASAGPATASASPATRTCRTSRRDRCSKATRAGRRSARSWRRTCESWSNGGKPRGDAFVVATAFALAFNDAQTDRQAARRDEGRARPHVDRAEGRRGDGTGSSATGRRWSTTTTTARRWPRSRSGYAPGDYAKTDAAKAGHREAEGVLQEDPAAGPAPQGDAALGVHEAGRPDDRRRAEEGGRGAAGEAAQGRRLEPAVAGQLQARATGRRPTTRTRPATATAPGSSSTCCCRRACRRPTRRSRRAWRG